MSVEFNLALRRSFEALSRAGGMRAMGEHLICRAEGARSRVTRLSVTGKSLNAVSIFQTLIGRS